MRADDAVLARAVEESLRVSPPILFVARGCVRETTVGDVTLQPGARLVVGTGCANRDEAVFEDGEQFDVGRENADQHLSFGYGPHVCPGATLAARSRASGSRRSSITSPPGAVSLEPGFAFENVSTFFEVGPRSLPVVLPS